MAERNERSYPLPLKASIKPASRASAPPTLSALPTSPTIPADKGSRSSLPNIKPSHHEISIEAEVIWRNEGCPQERDTAIWLEAERRLTHGEGTLRTESVAATTSDPLAGISFRSDRLMGELNDLFPGQMGRETTSL